MPPMNRLNELVQSFLLIGSQVLQMSPTAMRMLPARYSHVVRSDRSRFNFRMCPAMTPSSAVAIEGKVLMRPSGSQSFVPA